MGTSSKYLGPKRNDPILPSWQNGGDKIISPTLSSFQKPRNNFNRFIKSNGKNRKYLYNAISNYISKTLGGPKNASNRIGISKNSAINFLMFYSRVQVLGLEETLKTYKIEDLFGKNAKDLLLGITEFICPNGGSIDEGIARNSYIKTIESIPELVTLGFENFKTLEIKVFLKTFISNVIKNRILIDIGNRIIELPDNIELVYLIEKQLYDCIEGAVSDAIENIEIEFKDFDSIRANDIIEKIYQKSFDTLEKLSLKG